MDQLFRIHDKLTEWGKWLAVFMLVLIAASFSYEVAARYLFNAPTSWANAFVAYFLCAAIFLVVPEISRRNTHVVINLIYEWLSPRPRRMLELIVRFIAGAMCFFAAWFCAVETWQQFTGGIDTISALPIPKWIVSIFVPYGFISTGLYFFRQMRQPPAPAPEGFPV